MREGVNWKALALAGGAVWGGYLALAALLEMLQVRVLMFNRDAFVLLQAFYPGIAATPAGVAIALVWGFLCAAVALGLAGALYNALSARLS